MARVELTEDDVSYLVAHFQALCVAICYWEPMGWNHPAIQQWLVTHDLAHCSGPWRLPPAALWVLVQNLDRKLKELQSYEASKKATLPL
jgi:hypothetical protein